MKFLFFPGSHIGDHADDFRNDVARALNDDAVADADILAIDFVLIVKRGAANRGAAEIHRG